MIEKETNKQRGVSPIAVVIIALIVLGVGYLLLRSKGSVTTTTNETTNNSQVTVTTPPEPTATPVLTIVMKTQNKSGETGTTTISSMSDGKTKVEIALAGAPADVEQPAHIHLNACKNIGDVKYPLANVVNGMSSTILDVATADLLNGAPLSINVHQSADKLNVYTACGDIGATEKKAGLNAIQAIPPVAPVMETGQTPNTTATPAATY